MLPLEGLTLYLSSCFALRELIRQERPDILHAHTILPDGFSAALLSARFDLPVVCTVHGSDIKIHPRRNWATMWSTKWALKRTRTLVAVSQDLKTEAERLGATGRIEVVHNGADHRVFSPIPKLEARNRLGLPADLPLILFLGNLVPIKGVEFLLDALANLREFKPVLALAGDGELSGALRARARNLGIEDCCRFPGTVSHSTVAIWLSAADCMVLPSLSEGMPTAVAEAMLCRVPVVATSVGGTPEIVEHKKTGLLVPPRNSQALTNAIAQLLNDPEAAAAMAAEAHARASKTLTWDVNARAMLHIYRSVIDDFRADRVPGTSFEGMRAA